MKSFQDQLAVHFFNAIGAISYVLPLLVALFILEKLYPYQKKSLKDEAFNFLYTPVFLTVSLWLLDYSKISLFDTINFEFQDGMIILNELNIGIKSILYLIFFDFFYYWFHRAQHTSSFLWRYHSFHHSDNNVSVLTTSRHHCFEEPLRLIPIYLPIMILFGQNSDIPFFILTIPGVYGIFIHLNTSMSFSRFSKIIVTPIFHRIHHSTAPDHLNKNYSILLPLWDIIFKTADFSNNNIVVNTGINSRLAPNDIRRLWIIPKV